jgi:hypothetical protein
MALNGGSSAVSCSETPPLQPSGPLRLCRMERDGEDVQPANGSAGTLRILAASSGDWTVDGGKNSIYAPRPFSHSHLPIRPSLGPTTASVRTGRADPERAMALDGSRYLSQILTARPMECCRGPRTAQPPPFRLAIRIISDGSGPSRIRDRATLTGRIRSPHYNDKVHRYSTDHDVGSVMGFRDLQAILHCCCSRCARAAVVRPLFAES